MTIRVERDGAVTIVTVDRPERRNAVDRPTAAALARRSLPGDAALAAETRGGVAVITSGEIRSGASRFAAGAGRHGRFDD